MMKANIRKILFTATLATISQPAFAIDDCLVGNWEPDYLTFGDQYLDVTGAVNVAITGDIVMSIADTGIGTYLVERLTMDVEFEGTPPTQVTLDGTGEFTLTTDADEGFFFNMGSFAYNAVATVDMGSGDPISIEVPVTDEMAPFGQAAGLYICNDEFVEYEPIRGSDGVVGNIIKKWFRLPY